MNREEPMIFFCFCEKDRLPLVNDFFRFLSNFGLSILYDRGNIFLGDEHYTNIETGVNNPEIKYAVIFYSDNFKNRNICLEEFNTLCQRREKENLCLFPVFLGSCTEQIDAQFEICKKLVYKELFDYDGFAGLATSSLKSRLMKCNPCLFKHLKMSSFFIRKKMQWPINC